MASCSGLTSNYRKSHATSPINQKHKQTSAHTHTQFNGPFSGTTQVSQYQKGKTNLDFTEARDSEWQWHQLGHMQVCISLQTDNIITMPVSHHSIFLQAGCPSCHPTNSVKALKASEQTSTKSKKHERTHLNNDDFLIRELYKDLY